MRKSIRVNALRQRWRSSLSLAVSAMALSAVGCAGGGPSTDAEIGSSSAALTQDAGEEARKQAVIQKSRNPEPPDQASDRAHVSAALRDRLAKASPQEELDVDVFLRMPSESGLLDEISASGVIRDGETEALRLNGSPASEKDFLQLLDRQRAQLADRASARRQQAARLREELEQRTGIERAGASHSFRANLSARKIRDLLEENSDLIDSISEAFQPERGDGLASALTAIGVSGTGGAWDLGLDGDTVGVWMNDGNGRPDTSNSAIDTADFTAQDYGSEPLENHATQTTGSLMTTAPEAHVHFAVPTESCNLRDDVDTFSSPPVYISSLSNDTGTSNSYTNCSRDWDNFVYNNRIAHFNLAHNDSGNVRHNAKAYNVITVGAYNDGTGAMAGFSNFQDPDTGAEKPEVVAPGVDIDVGGFSGLSGTSYATPIAAGLAADLMEDFTYLRYQPQLLKAILMGSAINIEGGTPISELDGAGRVDFGRAYYNGRWRWWTGSNGSHFSDDSDGDGRKEITFSEANLNANETYRVVIVWLVEGNYVRNNKEPNMDIDLKVTAPGGTSWYSLSVDNAFEVVEFTAPQSGTYDIVIERWSNSGTGDVALGYHFNWD